MAACDFDIELQGDVQDVLQQARQAVLAQGGSFDGDTQQGTFSGSSPLGDIAGTYSVTGSTIHIAITHKPFLVSCGLIESRVRAFFGG